MVNIAPLFTDSATLAAMDAADEDERASRPNYSGYGISASEAGTECARRLWLMARWASPPEKLNAKSIRIFERGDWEEQRILERLRRAGIVVQDKDPVTGKQWRFSLAQGWLRGKADGIILSGLREAPKAAHVVEIKSMKAEKWRLLQRKRLQEAIPEHWHQLHSGMAGLGIERGVYVAVNKDTEEIYLERIELDHEVIASVERRVIHAVSASEPPPKLMDAPKKAPCVYCSHRGLCFDRGWSVRSCRTCCHFSFTSDGNGHCARFSLGKNPQEQREGCPEHVFLPALVPGEVVDSDEAANTVTYKLPDGSTFVDGVAR
jgi:CRISPR/Cas system-associated exonuclease Cas4 (RecB family)